MLSARRLTSFPYRAQAAVNGEVVGEYESYTGSTFNSLGIAGDAVETLTLTSVGLTESEWISFLEVSGASCCRTQRQPKLCLCHVCVVIV